MRVIDNIHLDGIIDIPLLYSRPYTHALTKKLVVGITDLLTKQYTVFGFYHVGFPDL